MLLELEMSPYELYYCLICANTDLGSQQPLLESLWNQNTHFRARFRQTSYKDLVFARGESLSVVGAQNECLRIILMSYMFKY